MRTGGHRRRWVARGWWAFLAAFLGCVVLGGVDRQLKVALHPGYCPADAAWSVHAADLPRFWDSLKGLDAARSVGERLPRELHLLELAVRQATGIRPTPARWGVWLGPRVLCAGRKGQWGICVRPGVLLRAADGVNRIFGGGHDMESPWRYGDFYYAWREGYLIASASPAYVRDSLAAPVSPDGVAVGPDSLCFKWKAPSAGEIRVHAADALPVSGRVAIAISKRDEELASADIWPDRPLLAVSGGASEDWGRLLAGLMPVVENAPMMGAARRFARMLGSAWGIDGEAVRQFSLALVRENTDEHELSSTGPGIREFSLALVGADFSETLPVPELALALRAGTAVAGWDAHPLRTLTPAVDTLPYAWREQEGLIGPVLGEKVSLCLACDGAYWLAATQGPVMEKLVGRLRGGPAARADLMLRVDWEKSAEAGAALIRRAAQLELVPRMDAREAEARLIPFMQALASMGALELQGRGDGECLQFSGFLARHGDRE